LLRFSNVADGNEMPPFLSVLKDYCAHHKVINTRSVGADGETLEISNYVKLRDKGKNSEFVRDLQNVKGVQHVNLYSDEEHI